MAIKELIKLLENELKIPVFAYEADSKTQYPFLTYQINYQDVDISVDKKINKIEYETQLNLYSQTLKESENLKALIRILLLEKFIRPITYLKFQTYLDHMPDPTYQTIIELRFFI